MALMAGFNKVTAMNTSYHDATVDVQLPTMANSQPKPRKWTPVELLKILCLLVIFLPP